jgi:uncharacterized repeat protein (TIGR03803 family)
MTKNRVCILKAVTMLALASVAFGTIAQAQTFTDLYNFGTNVGDPEKPFYSGIIAQGRDGSLYSTTPYGGAHGLGTVFKITLTGKLKVIHDFGGQQLSYGGLTLGTDGNLFGTTAQSGENNTGAVFEITPAGRFTILHKFTSKEGAQAFAPPIQGDDGYFYGTTTGGGTGGGYGTVYKVSGAGLFTVLHSFDNINGASPYAPLVQGADGSFYGTTNLGGTNGDGTVFKITRQGKFATLYSFDGTDGANPYAPLIQATHGSFYGTTYHGGTNGYGTVFKITRKGKITVLHSMSLSDGRGSCGGLVLGTDGNFYGTAAGDGGINTKGTIYRVGPKGRFKVVQDFAGLSGNGPLDTLLQHTAGTLYGTTWEGGNFGLCDGGCGVFYSENVVGLGTYAALVSSAGRVGKTVGILGQGFKGSTAVSFNGTPTQFRVVSNTFLEATVPTGATTGLVTVSTPTGNLVSKQNFRVVP